MAADSSVLASLRKLIDRVLPTAADFDGFCLDHFRPVHARFGDGMERKAKVNLLLALVEAEEIIACLCADHAAAFYKHSHLLRAELGAAKPMSPSAPRAARRPAASRSATDEAPIERPILTVHLSRTGGSVTIRYSVPDQQKDEHATSPLPSFLSRPCESKPGPWPAGLGDELFRLLFPDPVVQERLLQHLFGLRRPSPRRQRLRVRILTPEAELMALPWELVSFDDRPLGENGWSFERVTEEAVTGRAVLPSPVRVLVLAPDGPGAAEHSLDLRRLLDEPEPAFFQVAKTRRELQAVLRSFQPDLVYFLGRGCVENDRAQLLLQQDERLPLDELRRMLQKHPPRALVLNGGPPTMDAKWLAAPRLMMPEVPVVVIGRGGPFLPLGPALGIQLLRRFLGDALEPPVALTKLESPPNVPAEAALSAFVAWTAYGSLVVRPQIAQRTQDQAHLRLDRTIARGTAFLHVSELLKSERRVEALIAHADSGNLLTQFSWQVVDHIEHQGLAPIRALNLQFPTERAGLPQRLLEELLLRLEAPGQTLAAAVKNATPKVRGQAPARVLWLDWGCLGESGGLAPLKQSDLRAWLQFCFDTLVRVCPHDVRIVSYLALHVAERNQKRLSDDVEEFRRKLPSDQFRAYLLPALPFVKQSELLDFLTEPSHTTCGRSLAPQVAELIYADTRGIYDQTVRHIAWAEANGWGALIGRLSGSGDSTPAPAKDEVY